MPEIRHADVGDEDDCVGAEARRSTSLSNFGAERQTSPETTSEAEGSDVGSAEASSDDTMGYDREVSTVQQDSDKSDASSGQSTIHRLSVPLTHDMRDYPPGSTSPCRRSAIAITTMGTTGPETHSARDLRQKVSFSEEPEVCQYQLPAPARSIFLLGSDSDDPDSDSDSD